MRLMLIQYAQIIYLSKLFLKIMKPIEFCFKNLSLRVVDCLMSAVGNGADAYLVQQYRDRFLPIEETADLSVVYTEEGFSIYKEDLRKATSNNRTLEWGHVVGKVMPDGKFLLNAVTRGMPRNERQDAVVASERAITLSLLLAECGSFTHLVIPPICAVGDEGKSGFLTYAESAGAIMNALSLWDKSVECKEFFPEECTLHDITVAVPRGTEYFVDACTEWAINHPSFVEVREE